MLHRGLHRKVFTTMVSNRIKADARTHMAKNPGTRYQEALRAVAVTPTSVDSRLLAARAEIDAIIGQDAAKKQLHLFSTAGATKPPHLLFSGEPGTGKTRTAHILARTLFAAGAVDEPIVVHVGRSELVGVVEGETALKTSAAFDSAYGGVLLVDDAHNLVQDRGAYSDPFGSEALDTLADKMRGGADDVVVVFSGHGAPLRRILGQNLRFAGMFGRIIEFTSPTPDEMWLLLNNIAEENSQIVEDSAKAGFTQMVESLNNSNKNGHPGLDVVGNARFAQGVIDEAQRLRDSRLATSAVDLVELTDEQLKTLAADDVTDAARHLIHAAGQAAPLFRNPDSRNQDSPFPLRLSDL